MTETSAILHPDRAAGTLVGLAAGDRNGGPIQMALRLAESLVGLGTFDPGDVFARYLDWYRNGAFDTGPVAMAVFRRVDAGMAIKQAVEEVDVEFERRTAGCNPAHRAAPLAMAAFVEDEWLSWCAVDEAALTHGHLLAGDTAAAVAVLIRSLIRGHTLAASVERARQGRLAPVVDALTVPRPANTGGYAPEVLRAALHFVATRPSFAEALEASIEFAGPANYCPVLVGSIGGARWGASAIPSGQLDHCADLDRVWRAVRSLQGVVGEQGE
jgi:ADP-ribosyl-[dinitrogen reductase] hydrolase